MRITRRPPIAGVAGLEEVTSTALPPPTPSSVEGRPRAANEEQDRVELSEAARLRQRLRAEVGDVETTTTSDRVANLRAQVTGGTYQPAPRAVAERLLAEVAGDLLS